MGEQFVQSVHMRLERAFANNYDEDRWGHQEIHGDQGSIEGNTSVPQSIGTIRGETLAC